MRKIFVVASREYIAAVRSKAFLVSLVVMPLLMFGGIFVQRQTAKMSDIKTKHIAIVDRSPGGTTFDGGVFVFGSAGATILACFAECAGRACSGNDRRRERGVCDGAIGVDAACAGAGTVMATVSADDEDGSIYPERR